MEGQYHLFLYVIVSFLEISTGGLERTEWHLNLVRDALDTHESKRNNSHNGDHTPVKFLH